MPERHPLRTGAVAAIGGGLLALIGNILHPREPGQLDNAASLFEVVAHTRIWVADHFLISIALALLLNGFSALTRSITGERGSAWAGFAWNIAVIGIVFGLALMLTEATAVPALAEQWSNGSGPEKDLALAAGSAIFELSLTFSIGGMLFLFGLAPVLYGVAILTSHSYRPWLGWLGAVFGSVNVAGATIELFTGEPALTFFVLFPLAAIVITLWIIYLGVLMWQRAEPTLQPIGAA